MYHITLSFIISSNNDKLGQVLKTVSPIEDCEYRFIKIEDVEKSHVGLDTIFIFDGIDRNIAEAEGFGECVAILSSDSEILGKPKLISRYSDIWVMPNGKYDDALLRAYFLRLAIRMKTAADNRKQKICFDTLINSVPNLVWFKDIDGAHLIVNDSFCQMVGKTKEQIYKKGHCYIWDATPEDEEVCLSSDRIIMKSRKTNTFEEPIIAAGETQLLKSYKSALIDEDGEVFGTCGIAHDVTELKNIKTELQMVIDNIPFPVLLERKDGIVTYKNRQFDENFPEYFQVIGKKITNWRNSLVITKEIDNSRKEIIVRYGDQERTFILEEEPFVDIFRQVMGNIITLADITEEYNISKANEYHANTDFLTGIPNRRWFETYMEDVFLDESLSVIAVDLDNFKLVNDTWGHDAGDRALIITAQILQESFKNDFVARMGGDEFIIAAVGQTEEMIREKARDLLRRMSDAENEHKELSKVTASIGIVFAKKISPDQKDGIDKLVQLADEQLYRAKNSGKNRCCIYGE